MKKDNNLSDKCFYANCDGDECIHNDEDNNICEHNNTITNECSDCNEQELFDVFLKHTLRGIRYILWNTNNNVSDLIDDLFVGDVDYNEKLADKLQSEILRRLNYEEK